MTVQRQHQPLGTFASNICTSLSSCFASKVICLMTSRGASSESLTMNAETDLGPRVSFELNSLFPSSLYFRQLRSMSFEESKLLLQNFIGQLRVVVLFREDMQKFCHWFRKMLEIGQALYDRRLGT